MKTLFFGVCGMVGLVGCSSSATLPRPATTTTTGAGLENEPSSTLTVAAPAAREAAVEAAADEKDTTDRPAGDLVCRTKTTLEGTTELYLTWSEGTARGFIRNVAPSGMVYVRPIHAERYKSMIVVDGPSEPDLATHTAVVSKDAQTGKPFMRLGDQSSPWTACE